MEIIHELPLDLQQTGTRQTMYAKQGDSLTRTARLVLYDGGTEFTVPDGMTLQIAYAKPDGKGGLYDTMPDGELACTAAENVVTAKLHPQMFTVAGLVTCELRIVASDGTQLSTFSWIVTVQASATAGITSEDYYNYATLNGVRDEIGDISELATTVKDSLVAAINSVYATVDTVSKNYIRGVNGKQRDVSGNVEIYAEDIDTQVQGIQYQGNVQGALEEIAARTALPVARGESGDGISYTATGTALPDVSAADSAEQIIAVGKGRQVVFVPNKQNASNAPTLQLNGGEVIPIRLRAPETQNGSEQSPDATIPVPVGALMRGVPYTMTFCGKFWLIDSQIAQFEQSAADKLSQYADRLTALTDGGSIAAPIVNAYDGIAGDLATMFVQRSAEETAAPVTDGAVTVPTVGRVKELLCADATEDFTASGAGSIEQWATMARTDDATKYRVSPGRYKIDPDCCGYTDHVAVIDSKSGAFRFVWTQTYTDEFAYITLHLVTSPNETPLRQMYFSTEEYMLEIFGKNHLLPYYELNEHYSGAVLTVGTHGPEWKQMAVPRVQIAISLDTNSGTITGATQNGNALPLTNAAGNADYGALLNAINDTVQQGGTVELEWGGRCYSGNIMRSSDYVLITYFDIIDPFDPDAGFALYRALIDKYNATITYSEV